MSEILKDNKAAIVLFNLGGPDKLENVRPFLYNLFSDPAIIRLPGFLRKIIAFFIAKRREKSAQENYKLMSGKSPLLEETIAQQQALTVKLIQAGYDNFKIFISMRYWHPFSDEVIAELENYDPKQLILLPLYPQFSTTTTESSIKDFTEKLKNSNITAKVKTIGCYPLQPNFIKAHQSLLIDKIAQMKEEKFEILFSAHSLPKKIIDSGDPYQWQIITYQSKVGPVEWLKPNTEDVIEQLASQKINLIVVPIAFVSEHIETLVELDIEYAAIAKNYDVKYLRVQALQVTDGFISCLSSLVTQALGVDSKVTLANPGMCPEQFKECFCRKFNHGKIS